MNELTKFLVDGILNEDQKQTIALFGGGFKPPTKGHLDVIINGLRQNPEINKVKIIVGGGKRGDFNQIQSAKIWEIYRNANLIPVDVEIIKASPFKYYKDYLTQNPNDKVFVFIGSREGDEDDQFDVKERSEYVKKYSDNVIPVEVATTGGVSGTEARDLFQNNIKNNSAINQVENVVSVFGEADYSSLQNLLSEDIKTSFLVDIEGAEYQLLDDLDSQYVGKLKESQFTGALYDMIPPKNPLLKPVGTYNSSRILVDGNHVEHWLNERKVIAYDFGSERIDSLYQKSKYHKYPNFIDKKKGHIILQNHKDEAWFRNIKIREIK